MFRSPTLFVVGAGASNEVDLPVGAGLKASVAKLLNIRFHHHQQTDGDTEIWEALRRAGLRDCQPAAWAIRDAMPQALSIDNYLDAHRGDEKVELCGKLAIARAILNAERESKLFIDDQFVDRQGSSRIFNLRNIEHTWYNSFMQILTEDIRRTDIDRIFENVSFITFNYDRCIEHFLMHSIKNYYRLSVEDVANVMGGLIVTHPYGKVGGLPWQREEGFQIEFGSPYHNLLEVASQIKTFYERTEDQAALAKIKAQVMDAKVIVFLGFAFHQQNMDLIRPEGPSEAERVFGTAFRISDGDCFIVRRQIEELIGKDLNELMGAPYRHDPTQVELRNDLTCADLFGQCWRRLSLA